MIGLIDEREYIKVREDRLLYGKQYRLFVIRLTRNRIWNFLHQTEFQCKVIFHAWTKGSLTPFYTSQESAGEGESDKNTFLQLNLMFLKQMDVTWKRISRIFPMISTLGWGRCAWLQSWSEDGICSDWIRRTSQNHKFAFAPRDYFNIIVSFTGQHCLLPFTSSLSFSYFKLHL